MSSNNSKRLWAPFASMDEWDGKRVAVTSDDLGTIPLMAACIAYGARGGRVHLTWWDPQFGRGWFVTDVSNRDVLVVP